MPENEANSPQTGSKAQGAVQTGKPHAAPFHAGLSNANKHTFGVGANGREEFKDGQSRLNTAAPLGKEPLNAPTKAESQAKESALSPKDALKADLELLKDIDVAKALQIKMQGGQYGDLKVNDVLERRFNLAEQQLQGPFFIRVIGTLMFVFIFLTAAYGVIWAVGTLFKLDYFVKLVSAGISALMAIVFGMALFNPMSMPDEQKLKDFVQKRLSELDNELSKL